MEYVITRPEHLCASVEKAAKRHGQVSWLRENVLITVARPRGIHTRFPILPDFGAPIRLIKKIRANARTLAQATKKHK